MTPNVIPNKITNQILLTSEILNETNPLMIGLQEFLNQRHIKYETLRLFSRIGSFFAGSLAICFIPFFSGTVAINLYSKNLVLVGLSYFFISIFSYFLKCTTYLFRLGTSVLNTSWFTQRSYNIFGKFLLTKRNLSKIFSLLIIINLVLYYIIYKTNITTDPNLFISATDEMMSNMPNFDDPNFSVNQYILTITNSLSGKYNFISKTTNPNSEAIRLISFNKGACPSVMNSYDNSIFDMFGSSILSPIINYYKKKIADEIISNTQFFGNSSSMIRNIFMQERSPQMSCNSTVQTLCRTMLEFDMGKNIIKSFSFTQLENSNLSGDQQKLIYIIAHKFFPINRYINISSLTGGSKRGSLSFFFVESILSIIRTIINLYCSFWIVILKLHFVCTSFFGGNTSRSFSDKIYKLINYIPYRVVRYGVFFFPIWIFIREICKLFLPIVIISEVHGTRTTIVYSDNPSDEASNFFFPSDKQIFFLLLSMTTSIPSLNLLDLPTFLLGIFILLIAKISSSIIISNISSKIGYSRMKLVQKIIYLLTYNGFSLLTDKMLV